MRIPTQLQSRIRSLACLLLAGLACIQSPLRAAEIIDDFSDNDIAEWTRFDVFQGAGVVGTYTAGAGAVRIRTGLTPAPAFGPAVAGLVRTNVNWTNFTVRADFSGWTQVPDTNTVVGIAGRARLVTPVSADGYVAFVYLGRAAVSPLNWPQNPLLVIQRLDASQSSLLDFVPLPDLDPARAYTLEFSGEGSRLSARVHEAGLPDRLIGMIATTDARHASGGFGIVTINREGFTGLTHGVVEASFDNFVARDSGQFTPPQPVTRVPTVVDDFSDGDDRGWTRLDPHRGVGTTNSFSVTSGAYRMSSPAPSVNTAVGQVGAYLAGARWDNFGASVEFTGWNAVTQTNIFIMLTARFTERPKGSNDFYALRVVHGPTPLIPNVAQNPFLAIDRWIEGNRLTLTLAPLPSLDPSQTYRMVFEGQGTFLRGWLYSTANPSVPLAFLGAEDRQLARGSVGLLAMDRFGAARRPAGSGTQIVWDNFRAWGVQNLSDDFSDGNDAGWNRYEPFAPLGIRGTFAIEGGAYRFSHGPSPLPSVAPAIVGGFQDAPDWSDFDIEAEVSGWSTGAGASAGIVVAARTSRNADGTVNAYGLSLSPSPTTVQPGGTVFPEPGLTIDVIESSKPARASLALATLPPLDPSRWYVLRFRGFGPLLQGEVRERGSSQVLARVVAQDTGRYSGGFGLVAYDRAALAGSANNGVSALFDNVRASGLDILPPNAPGLVITPTLTLEWPAAAMEWRLESASSPDGPWTPSGAGLRLEGQKAVTTVPVGSGPQFFRLRQP